ncbi:MAG: SDR family oxidoreductase [Dehalococcoidia bacterium]|nr:SDR family oxidoreductase [Dehalococcoidia bacterium]
MANMLAGKTAIVTGSGQGIGRAVAMLLASEGARVVTNSRSPQSDGGTAATTAQEIAAAGGKATAVFADASTMAGARALVDGCVAAYGRVDILVNNAGQGLEASPFIEMTEEQWDRDVAINLKSHFCCNRLAGPMMRAQGWGRIVNTSSMVAVNGTPGLSAYGAAKAGVIALTVTMGRELAGTGVTVNCIMPTATTARSERTRAQRWAVTGAAYGNSPNRTPEHIAPLAGFLASDAAAGITGQVFRAVAGHVTLFGGMAPQHSLTKQGRWTVEELARELPQTFGATLAPLPPGPIPS